MSGFVSNSLDRAEPVARDEDDRLSPEVQVGETGSASRDGSGAANRRLVMAIIGLQVKGSALCEAARAGHVEIVRLLLQHQAPIDSTRSVDQLTPLQYAALQHHKDVAMALLAAGADPMKLSKDGERAIELLVAEMRKDAPELQPLLAKYLNRNRRTCHREPARLGLAASSTPTVTPISSCAASLRPG